MGPSWEMIQLGASVEVGPSFRGRAVVLRSTSRFMGGIELMDRLNYPYKSVPCKA